MTAATITPDEVVHLLGRVKRPGRYAGGERGACVKDWGGVKLRTCVCFPDLYELGMSYLGTAILHHLINRRTDSLAERAYAPDDDLYRLIKERGTSLWSLETMRPLGAFDALLFSLTYECSYPQMLRMLDAGGVPILAAERGDDDPIVLAGGGCTANPEPVADFVDAFGIGDAEVLLDPMLDCLIETASAPRRERLLALSTLQGVYVPSLFEADYEGGRFLSITSNGVGEPSRITRQFHQSLEECPIPPAFPVPNIDIARNKEAVEILRGCPKGCRFCQAGYTYRPTRPRSPKTVLEAAKWLTASSGRSEITLQSLSSLDHPGIAEMLSSMRSILEERRVSVTLPSLRMDALSRDLAQAMAMPRETSLTFSIEAGSQRLRDAINKNVSEEDIFKTLDAVLQAGRHKFKLYFMCGFEGETMADIEKLGDLVRCIHSFCRTHSGRKVRLHISQSVLVPKPVTPLAWQAMERPQVTRSKQALLARLLKPLPGVKFSWHDAEMSLLEALLSRGDRRLSKVLLRMQNEGRLPPTLTSGHFNASPWLAVSREEGIDPELLLYEEWPSARPFPWSHIDSRITEEFLQREHRKFRDARTTGDCCETCPLCGLDCKPGGAKDDHKYMRAAR